MKTYIEILELLEKESSTNSKIDLVKSNKDNPELKAYFKLILDKKITFGIAEFDYNGGTPCPLLEGKLCSDLEAFEKFYNTAKSLIERSFTGNSAIKSIKDTFINFTPIQKKWFEKCIKKDISSIGFGQSMYEKAYNETAFKFRCNLAEEEAELPKFDWSKGASIEIKLNGIRTLTQVNCGLIEWIKGRSGLEIETFYPIIEEMKKVFTVSDSFVVDGEVHCENNLQNTMTVFGTIVNLSRCDFKTDKAYVKWEEEKQKVALELRNKCTYDIFDIIPISEFESQTCSRTYLQRRSQLQDLQIRLTQAGITKVRIVESHSVINKDMAVSVANNFMSIGLEGGILKANGAKYEYKRARNFIKIKECTGEFEAEIVDVEISKDIYNTDGSLGKPQAGKITLRYINDIGTYSVSGCGTGKWLTKAMKEEIAENPQLFVGKIVTISGQCFSEDHIIQVPRIERLRNDRTNLDE